MTDHAWLGSRECVVSVSGGKDSAATSLHLRELGIPHRRIFADTGWEHPDTYAYLRGPLTAALGPIVEVRAELGFADLVRKKGMFPSRKRRFCTQVLKVEPLAAWFRAQDEDLVNVVGIRAAESKQRAQFPEREWSDLFDCEVWRPLLGWSEADVIAIHTRHGLVPNPLYLRGATRVGCWPCIHARKEELLMVATADPGRIDEIRQLEADVAAEAARRYAERGESFASLGHYVPTYFQAPVEEDCHYCGGSGFERTVEGSTPAPCKRCKGKGRRRNMWPIDKMVSWARTAHGGRQLKLIHDAPEGCARWGLCEQLLEEDE